MSPHTELLPEPLPPEPLVALDLWLRESWQRRLQPNPNSMVVATVGADGHPSARVVLCKEVVPQPGYVQFYTNYESRKGRELAGNSRAAAVLHWDHLHRQVRLEGLVVKAPESESDAYFASRPWQSRLGAWASSQSQPIAARKDLQKAVEAAAQRFGTPLPETVGAASVSDFAIPRPPYWGGYRLWVDSVELWVEGVGRIHDRAQWKRSVTQRRDGAFDTGPWLVTRLQP